ncbi:MAG TPA: hypothetical protein VHZ24_02810 [Pirellulales bacterium]|jgi:hypothetical protein|nr:hypothetical protein [Pirellulales bacterium]
MDREFRLRPPSISNREIIKQAEKLSTDFLLGSGLPATLAVVSFDTIYQDIIYPTYGIQLEEDDDLGIDADGKKIFGKYDPVDNVAFVDVCLRKDPRRVFTCWHEVAGHGILQGECLRAQMRGQRGCIITTASSLDFEVRDILERQANLYARHVAAPTAFLCYTVENALNLTRPIQYVGPGTYMLNIRGAQLRYTIESLNDLCRIIARSIQWRFGLSLEALSYRIQQLRIFNDVTKAKVFLHRVAPATTAGASYSYALTH